MSFFDSFNNTTRKQQTIVMMSFFCICISMLTRTDVLIPSSKKTIGQVRLSDEWWQSGREDVVTVREHYYLGRGTPSNQWCLPVYYTLHSRPLPISASTISPSIEIETVYLATLNGGAEDNSNENKRTKEKVWKLIEKGLGTDNGNKKMKNRREEKKIDRRRLSNW